MKVIGAFDAKNRLGHLLDLAEKGEEIVITRHGKQVARLLPISQPFDREAARRAVEEIKSMRKGLRLGDATIKGFINEGRA